MSAVDRFHVLKNSSEPVKLDELYALYDSLEPVPTAFMHGEWSGGVFNTGHPGERRLAKLGWQGKSFHHDNDVDPIVCRTPEGEGGRVASSVLGKASLRTVVYRGVPTATMVYDNHPIFDHFRKLSDNQVLGVMDHKGDPFPLFFYLERI